MSEGPSFLLQKAVYERLAADAGVQALLGAPARLYDAPPADAIFPYALIAEARMRDVPGVAGGLEHELRIQAVSKYEGRREVKAILNAVYDALHEASVSAEAVHIVQIRFVFSDIFPRAETGVYQGVARFRAMTLPVAIHV